MLANHIISQFLSSGCILSTEGDQIEIGWGTPVQTAHRDTSVSGMSIYAPDFFLEDPQPWWKFPYSVQIKRDELVEALQGLLEGLEGVRLNWAEPDLGNFKTAFHDLKNRFRLMNLKKAVPVVFEKAKLGLSLQNKASLVSKLLLSTKSLPVYIYGFWNSCEGILGATPEVLFRKKGYGPLLTAALAGTRLKGDTKGPLIEDPKEREEHQIVIDGIRLSLEGMGSVKIGETEMLDLPTLSHLRTPIELEVDSTSDGLDWGDFLENTVRRLHPTPALGAFPRDEGLLWLQEYEKHVPRHRFGAPFGAVLASGEILCLVSIRNLQWKEDQVLLGAGCGIIPASELDRECREIQGKIGSVKKLLGLDLV